LVAYFHSAGTGTPGGDGEVGFELAVPLDIRVRDVGLRAVGIWLTVDIGGDAGVAMGVGPGAALGVAALGDAVAILPFGAGAPRVVRARRPTAGRRRVTWMPKERD
jgi:hypothetical protein